MDTACRELIIAIVCLIISLGISSRTCYINCPVAWQDQTWKNIAQCVSPIISNVSAFYCGYYWKDIREDWRAYWQGKAGAEPGMIDCEKQDEKKGSKSSQ